MTNWEELSKEQQDAVQSFRDAMCKILIAETETFAKAFPELQLTWSFNADASLRTISIKVDPSLPANTIRFESGGKIYEERL